MDTTFAVAKRKPEKKFRLVWDSKPCRYYTGGALLQIELASQLGAGR